MPRLPLRPSTGCSTGANRRPEVGFASELPAFSRWESKLPCRRRCLRGEELAHIWPLISPHQKSPCLRRFKPIPAKEKKKSLLFHFFLFLLFPYNPPQWHTRLPPAISAWLVRFPINGGAFGCRKPVGLGYASRRGAHQPPRPDSDMNFLPLQQQKLFY